MAKKKVNHQTQDPKQENPTEQKQKDQNFAKQQEPTMEETNETVQKLKSLNTMLLKETKEKRQQVLSLEQGREALEAELTRSGKERAVLEAELTRTSDERASLEIEMSVFCVFMATQMRKMAELSDLVDGLVREKRENETKVGALKSEVDRLMMSVESEGERFKQVCVERDLLRNDVDDWIQKANGLKERVAEMEKKEREGKVEIGKLKNECTALTGEINERENEIQEVRKLRDSAEKKLAERVKEIDCLKGEIGVLSREKNEIEMVKSEQKVKIGEFEREVEELKALLSSLQKEEEILNEKFLALEKSWGEAMEKEKGMEREIDVLATEKKEKEMTIQKLLEKELV